jgi:hypothetical protein
VGGEVGKHRRIVNCNSTTEEMNEKRLKGHKNIQMVLVDKFKQKQDKEGINPSLQYIYST